MRRRVKKGSERSMTARMEKPKLKSNVDGIPSIRNISYLEYIRPGQTVTGKFYVDVLERLRAKMDLAPRDAKVHLKVVLLSCQNDGV